MIQRPLDLQSYFVVLRKDGQSGFLGLDHRRMIGKDRTMNNCVHRADLAFWWN